MIAASGIPRAAAAISRRARRVRAAGHHGRPLTAWDSSGRLTPDAVIAGPGPGAAALARLPAELAERPYISVLRVIRRRTRLRVGPAATCGWDLRGAWTRTMASHRCSTAVRRRLLPDLNTSRAAPSLPSGIRRPGRR